MNIDRHQVSFCRKEEVDIEYVTSQLQVGTMQSSKIFRNSSNYYRNCFSSSEFRYEDLFDTAIMFNLRKFSQKFNNQNSIDSKMLLDLNNTINLSLFSFREKIKKIFFQPTLYGTCSIKICTVQGDGAIIYELMHGNIERDVNNARTLIWCFYALTAMTSAAAFLCVIFLHL